MVFQLWSSLVVSSRAIFGNLSCVFGEPAIARPCSALGVFWALSKHDFWCFLVSGLDFKGFGAPAVILFPTASRQVHTFVQVAPPDNRLGSKWDHQADFPPPSGVGFRTTFWYFSVFVQNYAIL